MTYDLWINQPTQFIYAVNLICYECDFYCSSPPMSVKHAGENTVKRWGS